jgi:hypothetical protein
MWSAALQWLKLRLIPPATPEVILKDVIEIYTTVNRFRTAQNTLDLYAKAQSLPVSMMSYGASLSVWQVWNEVEKYDSARKEELSLLDVIITQGRAVYVDSRMCTITTAEARMLVRLSAAADALELVYQKITEKQSVLLHDEVVYLTLL